jgi:hypothetical protein
MPVFDSDESSSGRGFKGSLASTTQFARFRTGFRLPSRYCRPGRMRICWYVPG